MNALQTLQLACERLALADAFSNQITEGQDVFDDAKAEVLSAAMLAGIESLLEKNRLVPKSKVEEVSIPNSAYQHFFEKRQRALAAGKIAPAGPASPPTHSKRPRSEPPIR